MDFIGKRILPWRTKRAIAENQVERSNISFREAQSIGVLFSSNGKRTFDAVNSFIQELTDEGKHVETLAFVTKNSDIPPSHIPYFAHSELSLFGQIKNPLAQKFAKKKFDYLLCLDLNSDIYIDHLIAISKAKMRVGAYLNDERNDLFELMIKLDGNSITEDLIREVKYFTKKLNRNDF